MVPRTDIERWIRGEPPQSPPAADLPQVRGIEVAPHRFLVSFAVEGIGVLAGELSLEDDSVALIVDLPWEIPEGDITWRNLMQWNGRHLFVRLVKKGTFASFVVDHPAGSPDGAYFDYWGVVLFLGLAQELIPAVWREVFAGWARGPFPGRRC